ncbi:BTB domain-containing protein [Mycena venus]|uniref:BTB domain-containing protein n=1 Tax=Mycena venus TaxID=2733690 RepID=A0A8H6U1J9_9AGAR|nr:BTB domain-containing protein [Mycena venus]
MRGLPQPAEERLIEGCPVIELHDSSTDVKYLLNALYNQLIFTQKSHPFPFIAAIVRLGRKYDSKNLLEAAVQRLTFENPSTLEQYQQLLGATKEILYRPTQIGQNAGIIFDTITLARENDLFALLPCAYLRAVLFHDQETILDGVSRVVNIDGVSRSINPPVTPSQTDQRLCLRAMRKFVQVQWARPGLWNWLSSDQCADGCTSTLSCTTRRKAILRCSLKNSVSLIPFGCASEPHLCSVCERHHLGIMAEERKKLWEDLPGFFDLPPWDELRMIFRCRRVHLLVCN